MRNFAAILVLAAALVACGRKAGEERQFRVEVANKVTPVKDQGKGSLGWIYAMLATIESERIMRGDSVNLSAVWLARHLLEDQAETFYLSRGGMVFSTCGTAAQAAGLLLKHGAMPYDSYRSDCNFSVLCRKLDKAGATAISRRKGAGWLQDEVSSMLDIAIRHKPKHVWMYGAQYSPREFARSVCADLDFVVLTSYAYKPYYEPLQTGVEASRSGVEAYNVPIDTLVACVERALRLGHCVCWEGDISNAGFSFSDGVAQLGDGGPAVTQERRQRSIDAFDTTYDHSMELAGIASDGKGQRYFVCKNSWGTGNPYGGMMYMSFEYARLYTVRVIVPAAAAITVGGRDAAVPANVRIG